jgi:hypothetical protein
MTHALTLEHMSPELLRVVDRAKRDPEGRFHSLAHLIDVPALKRAYERQRTGAAEGLDGMTKEEYGQNLEANLQDLHARLKAKQYRHQPIRRVHIPKAQGKTRPIGISMAYAYCISLPRRLGIAVAALNSTNSRYQPTQYSGRTVADQADSYPTSS